MSEPGIFKNLPATFPEKSKYRKTSTVAAAIFHVVLALILVVFPLLLPEKISPYHLLALVGPVGPPPAAPPPPPPAAARAMALPKVKEVRPLTPEALVIPTAIPKDIANIVDTPIASGGGVIGGVRGGTPGGVIGGILGNILSGSSDAVAPPPPPPPPPPKVVAAPTAPVRVGGNVKEPRPVKLVPPVYPAIASKARVSGTVVLEAVLTEAGRVDSIRVVSGHPFLVEAAITCVKQWQYEPTLLNGTPVRIILTAKVHFNSPLT